MNPANLRNKVNQKLNKLEGTKTLWISGGVDSMVLLNAVKLRRDIEVVHFHHGDNENKGFRDKAGQLVEKVCNDLKIPFKLIKYEGDKSSETAMRAFRMANMSELGHIVTAHHADDILETQLIKLIRGSHPESLEIESRSVKVMPLVDFNKNDLYEYARLCSVEYIEDPTNEENFTLRNYIRNEMIPAIESFNPNFQKQMNKSLKMFLEKIEEGNHDKN